MDTDDGPKGPSASPTCSDWIKLNVGGTIFTTTRGTLTQLEPDSMLSRMFTTESGITPSPRDSNGAYMIDRSAKYFDPILTYLRNGGQLILDHGINPLGVLEEARFYGIQSLVSYLEQLLSNNSDFTYDFIKCAFVPKCSPLTRDDVIRALITTDRSTQLRFQGVNLSGADLSRLDLRHVNFKYSILRKANLSGCNLSSACLERADLSSCNLDAAILSGVRMICANLEGSSLKGINAEAESTSITSMEGINLKNADLDGSCLAGVNMRVATLKNARLTNCDLRRAVLAGADLEHCNLSGSDLQETNLRGANLKDAGFELVMTPVHMAQVSNDLI